MQNASQIDVIAVRRLARDRVANASLRAVADEIGMSKSGLDSFIKGRTPYSGTRAKLFAWYLHHREPSAAVAPEEVDAAITLLGRYIQSVGSESARQQRVREVAERLFHAEASRVVDSKQRRRR